MGNPKTEATVSVESIRALNDAFRKNLVGGRLFLTRGIVGRSDVETILNMVREFDKFTQGSDPYCEHDFGAFEMGADTIFWKIDYYDQDLQSGSPDPSNPNVTTRVLTVMLASEY